ncbi:MAG: hypothetical protein NVSMB43_26530 [Pseudarthrobacter sp.]
MVKKYESVPLSKERHQLPPHILIAPKPMSEHHHRALGPARQSDMVTSHNRRNRPSA